MAQTMQDYVFKICHYYEHGYTSGNFGVPLENNICEVGSPEYYAWFYGHNAALTNQMFNSEFNSEQDWEI